MNPSLANNKHTTNHIKIEKSKKKKKKPKEKATLNDGRTKYKTSHSITKCPLTTLNDGRTNK